jgi:hypothetical protein
MQPQNNPDQQNTQPQSEVVAAPPPAQTVNLPSTKSYNNLMTGPTRYTCVAIMVFLLVTIIGSMFGGGSAAGALILFVPCILIVYLIFRRKLVIAHDGITLHYALHKIYLAWNEISSFAYDDNDFIKAPYTYCVNGKKYRITMAFKLGTVNVGWRKGHQILSYDPVNQATMADLQSMLTASKNPGARGTQQANPSM